MKYILLLLALIACTTRPKIMTVNGWADADKMGMTLPHEHVLVDFIGADSIHAGRYDPDSVFARALPFLQGLKTFGCQTFVECTPQYLGRDVKVLQRLSQETGMNIITNTGYYGAAGQKFLPRHVFTESAEQLAQRWIAEWENGIDGTGVKPGFMKLGADGGPLTEAQKKIMEAGAITHLATGLTIAVHTGNGAAAREELTIFTSNGVAAEAFVWVHAQNEKDSSFFRELAGKGAWVEFDGVSRESLDRYVRLLLFMRDQNMLHRVLLSHDAGWYHVGEPGGGDYRGYATLFDELLPRLRQEGFTETEIDLVTMKNPAKAFAVRVRKK